ncbi:MAG TPA: PAS domain-containing protein [Streptosporangiaceae bacterium]|nr:PAS domain-containing protein [Streptosporangiaceae bacterium]
MSVDSGLAGGALAAAHDAIVTLDRAAKVTSWNHGAEKLLGFSRDDAMEHGLALIIPEDYLSRHIAGFHAAMDSGKLAHGGSVARIEAMTASGGRVVLGMSLGLIAGPDGSPAGVVAVLRPLGDAPVEFVPA